MHSISLPFNNEQFYIQFNSENVCVINSFRVIKGSDMKRLLRIVRMASFNRGISYARKIESWVREWKAHNILYKFNIKRKSTKNVDLNENENIFRRIGYFILSLFYWK